MKDEWIKRILAHNIRSYRAELCLGQQSTAKSAGISYRLLQSLEAAQGNPTLETISALGRVFRVTHSRLLRLHFLRLSIRENVFMNRFKDGFASSPIAVAVRNHSGVVLWGNQAASNLIRRPKVSFEDGPTDLLELLSPEMRAMMLHVMEIERRGLADTYFISINENGQTHYVTSHPTVILPREGKSPIFTAVHLVESDKENESDYFDFCDRLLQAVYNDL